VFWFCICFVCFVLFVLVARGAVVFRVGCLNAWLHVCGVVWCGVLVVDCGGGVLVWVWYMLWCGCGMMLLACVKCYVVLIWYL